MTRTEPDGSISVLADSFDGKRLKSPNDIVCQRNGDIWFTDPSFGIQGWWEGAPALQERPHAVYRIDAGSGQLHCVIDDLNGPNGLAFAPDEAVLYVVESRATPSRTIWADDVAASDRLQNKRLHIDADGAGALDGIAVDAQGNLWCGFGTDGRPGAPAPRPTAWTACGCTTAAASPSATSTCPSAAPTCALAAPTTTACSWPPAIRCMR